MFNKLPPLPSLSDLINGKVLKDLSAWADSEPLIQDARAWGNEFVRTFQAPLDSSPRATARAGERTVEVAKELLPLAAAILARNIALLDGIVEPPPKNSVTLRFETAADAARFLALVVPEAAAAGELYQRIIAGSVGDAIPGAWSYYGLAWNVGRELASSAFGQAAEVAKEKSDMRENRAIFSFIMGVDFPIADLDDVTMRLISNSDLG